ncbi:hypothetical protein ACIPJ2_06635 [Curtobacterium sp. NPDC090217]|uniref:hypothetical protein n=1 Tax=Curtobacterium sp. NPDC090217 TaxID=3363970 RepID=UPI0037F44443
MFRLGWQAYRTHFGDGVSVVKVRRALVFGAVVTVVAAAVMTGLDLAFDWTGPGAGRAILAVALLSLGVGLVAIACCPIGRPLDPAATINGRQVRPDTARTVRGSVQRYLVRTMPAMRPEDRHAVLTDTLLYRRGVIKDVTQWSPLVVGGLLASLAALLLGTFSQVVPLWFVLYAGNIAVWLHRLGRAERARAVAETLAPASEPA